MRMLLVVSLLFNCGWVLFAPQQALGQVIFRAPGDAIAQRIDAEADYLVGAGWYNLRSAQAESIQVNTMIRWKEDLRKIRRERYELETRIAEGKKLAKEDRKRENDRYQLQLRTDPSEDDIIKGDALNVLLADLMDPDITPTHWMAFQVRLPKDTSVKKLNMRYVPVNNNPHPLSSGEIALWRLDIAGRWPVPLMTDDLTDERRAYEYACQKLREHILAGKTEKIGDDLTAMKSSLESLETRAQKVVRVDQNFRKQAVAFVGELRRSMRMFDAKTIGYAQELLRDTSDHDVETVQELVGYTLKYRLRFSKVPDSTPSDSTTYNELYRLLKKQAVGLNVATYVSR